MHPLIRYGIRLAMGAGALVVVLYFVPFRSVAATLATLNPAYLAVGVVLQFVLRWVAALRMKVIADSQGMGLSRAMIWRILLAAQFYGMLLPGALAGGGATWMKYVQHGADRHAAVVAILLNRGVGFLVMALLGAAALFADLPAARSWGTVLAAMGGLALLALVHGRWWKEDATSATRVASWIRRTARELTSRLLLFGHIPPRDKLVVLGSSVLYELVAAGVLWCFAAAAGIAVSLVTVLWIRAALELILLVPLSVAGLGIREAGLVGLGALIGVAAPEAVAWSLTLFFGTVLVAVAGGLSEAHSASNRLLRPPMRPSRGAERARAGGAAE